MNKWILLAAVALIAAGCGRSEKQKRETPTRGDAVVMVDKTVFPMVESVVQVFESQYKSAHLDLLPLTEHEISELLRSDSLRLAVIARPLTPSEEEWFETKKVVPRVTEVAYDGIAVISNRESRDSIIETKALGEMLAGGKIDRRVLVFDNPASGLINYMKEFTGADSLAGVYSLNSVAEVLEYVATTPGAIGFVGVDWLYEADANDRPYLDRICVMAVGDDVSGYYKPTQNDIAEGKYPLTRKIYFVNVQGAVGLGMGFASFIAGDIGQRIILKSGLVPVTYPKREVVIRKQL